MNSRHRPLKVYVFVEDSRSSLGVATGSAVVGGRQDAPPGWVAIDYEGNIYDSPALARFANRACHAAGRHDARYPTVARRWVGRSELIEIGEYDEASGEVRLHGERERELLCRWLGVDELAEQELEAEGVRFAMRREVISALRSGDPARRALAEQLRRRYDIEA